MDDIRMPAALQTMLARRAATAAGRTVEVPFPAETYLSKGWDARFAARPVDCSISFLEDGRAVMFVRPGDEAAAMELIGA